MFLAVILIFANCLCGSALSAVVETQQLGHGRHIRQAPNSSDTQIQVTQMNIAFDLPDITAVIELLSGSVHLEGFKSVNNDKTDMTGTRIAQLFWVSIGHPHFIKTSDTKNPGDFKYFHSSNNGFTTYVQMMTAEQRAALATAAHNKYQIDIADRQVVHLILSTFYCNMLLYDEAGSRYLISGNISDFRHFPLRMDFDIPPGKIERILFSKLINESEEDLRFECHIESSGGKLIKSNTLSISYEQSQQMRLEEKLFGPAGNNGKSEIYVSRNQMTELAHELYSTLNIIEEYQMPETQFSEAFVNDFISQLAASQFDQVPVDTVLASISKYSFDISADLRPDIIKRDIGSFLSVNTSDAKSRIIFDERKYNDWADSYKVSASASASVPLLFKASFSAAVDISHRGTTIEQTLSDQMRELNTLSQSEAQWDIEGEKIVPKSLNVARIIRSSMKTSLTFKRVRFQQYDAPFARNFKIYTSRSSQLLCQNISAAKQRYQEMIESISHDVEYLMNASRGQATCKSIRLNNPAAPSKMYTINVANSNNATKQIDVYCEMGLNGGGYTFLTPESVAQLQSSELLPMFTDKTSFLLRVRMTNGSQPFGVLKQLSQYAAIPLKLNISDYSGYNPPVNAGLIGRPYLYFGFLPIANVSNNVQGLQVNGFNNAFTSSASTANSQFTLFPNFSEANTSTSDVTSAVCDQIFSRLLQNPSGRVMPPDIFMFGETNWGGSCYKQTNRIPGILSFAIGFR